MTRIGSTQSHNQCMFFHYLSKFNDILNYVNKYAIIEIIENI